MGSLKPWQLILVIVAAVVLVVSLIFSLRGPNVPKPGQVTVADVESGELFSIDTSGRKIALLPAKNPDTGERTLFPVRQDESGNWVITPMGSGIFNEYEGPAAAVLDRNAKAISVSGTRVRALD